MCAVLLIIKSKVKPTQRIRMITYIVKSALLPCECCCLSAHLVVQATLQIQLAFQVKKLKTWLLAVFNCFLLEFLEICICFPAVPFGKGCDGKCGPGRQNSWKQKGNLRMEGHRPGYLDERGDGNVDRRWAHPTSEKIVGGGAPKDPLTPLKVDVVAGKQRWPCLKMSLPWL